MFRFHKTLDIITLFHRPSLQSSTRALTLLKQLSAQSAATATEDQASDHSHQSNTARADWELNVTEETPTGDQVRSILEYIGEGKAGQVVDGSKNIGEAIKRLREDPARFKPPVIVDWNNGNAVLGFNESEILKMLRKKE